MGKNSKLDLSDRYRYDSNKNIFCIDILLDFYKELYNEWDFSPPSRRDLDEDLLTYLMECLEEIPEKHDVEVALSLPKKVQNPLKEERAITAYRNFFRYKIKRVLKDLNKQYRKILTFMIVGVILFSIALAVKASTPETFPYSILPEILFVGTWVAIWEAFEIILFTIPEMRKEKRNYNRLLNCNILYHYRDHPEAQPPDGPLTGTNFTPPEDN